MLSLLYTANYGILIIIGTTFVPDNQWFCRIKFKQTVEQFFVFGKAFLVPCSTLISHCAKKDC